MAFPTKQDYQKAIRRHKETGEHHAIVEIDCGECHRIKVIPLANTQEDEFEAFCGRILYTTEEES